QKLLSQARRLQQLHEQYDSLRINIVPADELFNEFSSGTPDASAYRRYLKMLYDRAATEADMPRYLLLFGDGAWDNRMLTTDWRQLSPDDFLLCYESENSWSETDCYVSDDFFCMLDDGEGSSLAQNDMADVGVGRLTARTEAEAKILVDKVQAYMENSYAGQWQNTLCFFGDDGNNNIHMQEAEAAADTATFVRQAFNVRRVFWDAYQRTSSSTGFRYPDAGRLIKQLMQRGALIMDYCGHGNPGQISHEKVLLLNDFAEPTSMRLPLWVTASCDIMPFDSQEDNIGETAMLNSRGGAIAFFGTTRTVYTGDNRNMNCSFLANVLSTGSDGRAITLGDAVRLSKNDVRTIGSISDRLGRTQSHSINKLHYSLLGDPALRLALPTMNIVVDSINGIPLGSGSTVTLKAGQQATVSGHIQGSTTFTGTANLTVKDVESQIVCRLNNRGNDGADTAFVYRDSPFTIYEGQDSIRNGRFNIIFALPQDISYSDDSGQMILHAVSSNRQMMAHGMTTAFNMGSSDLEGSDGIGPSVYCYLNTEAFQNGGTVNTTPWFYAQITDKDGINAAGGGIGHDMELTIDDDPSLTFTLNDYFQYDFGDYCTGTVGYSLPQLSEGIHVLRFRVWDMLNNSSVAELQFNVQSALQPNCFSVTCTRNPATTQTTFIVNHDRTGSQMDVRLEIFDTSGRMLFVKDDSGVPTDSTYQLDWDLTTDSGKRLPTGVYLYRVLISTDGSKKSSKAEKLIIL
ncbi:MAG: type IX secretion system sortase PorU, partial [Prevotella sp.]|nr:type IX secretion system sortase PorU [Prevotella sp.]